LTPLTILERTVVTCPTLIRCPPVAAEVLDDLSRGPARRARATVAPVIDRLRRDDVLAQFARFVLVGGSTTLVYALFFFALRDVGYLPAHLVATAASTVLANEMHRRLTFRAEDRVSWLAAQWEAGGVTVIGLVATSTALGWLDAATGSAPPMLQISVVVAVTALIGVLRFVALRWIFRPHVAALA
jgi:putative flippase GtrA